MWQRITTDQFILQTIQGYRLEFFAVPQQVVAPVTVVKGLTQQNVMQEEIEKLLLKGAIQLVSPSNGQFFSRLFLVPKKTGDLRPVINLRPLNKFIIRKHFKMENLQNVTQLVRKGDYMVTIDLKDAYFSIPIHQSHRKFLRFSWRNQLFQFAALPFGLTSAPRVFTKVLKPVIASMRQRGIRCLIYIDDLIIVASSKMECNEQAVFAVQLLTDLGFNVNMEKIKLSAENSSGIPRVCVGFDKNGAFSSREEEREHSTKNSKLTHEQTNFSSSSFKYGRLDAVGQMGSNASGYLLPISSTGFEQCSRRNRERLRLVDNVKSRSSAGAKDVVNKLGNVARQSNGDVASKFDNSDRCLPVRMGSSLPEYRQGGQRFVVERGNHVTHQCVRANDGMVCNSNACKCYNGGTCSFSNGQYNRGVLHNKQGGTKSCQMVIIAKKIWDWAIKHQVQVSAEHLPGKQNVTADKLSRELNDNLEWSLDREVFCKLIRKADFRPQVDLFATRLNAQVQKFVSWKPDPQAWKVDAFAITWTGIKAYAFPPFCLISRLLQKVHIENMSEMLLIAPVWKTQPWFPTLLSMLVRRPILLPQNRDLLQLQHSREEHPLQTMRLAGWLLSANTCQIKEFQMKQPSLYSLHGGQVPSNSILEHGDNGLAGVTSGRVIRFQLL